MTVPRRRPARSPEAIARLTRLLIRKPTVAGRLRHVGPGAQTRASPTWSGATVLDGEWVPADRDGATDHDPVPVLVKLGAGAREVHWAGRLARHAPDVIPTVYAAGQTLGGRPLPWLVLERCPLRLDYAWGERLFEMLLDAGVRFQLASRRLEPTVGPEDVAVARFCARVRRGAASAPPPPGPATEVAARLERDWRWVLSVCRVETCHGDLHPGNAVWRAAPPDPAARALLIDYAPQALPWAAEPAYCQVLYWPCAPPAPYASYVHQMAHLRRLHGLEVPEAAHLDRLARLFLGWHALGIWPTATHRHGNPEYVAAVRCWLLACAAS
jgi:hypothetical protein